MITGSTIRLFVLPQVLQSQGYAQRPETDADIPFLLRLYASTREDEIASIPWSTEQKAAFLTQQFHAQRRYYRGYSNPCSFDVLEQNGTPIGRLYLEARQANLHLIDIALMPASRRHGLGAAILDSLQEAARATGKGVSTFVEKFNPALRLYRRRGFQEVADHGVYLEMEWRPDRLKAVVA